MIGEILVYQKLVNLCSPSLVSNVFSVEDIGEVVVLRWIVHGATRVREHRAFSVGTTRGVPEKFVQEG